ncbi:ChaN family lipoprotein [candidate division KSB1 bacterium]|nr:ChaN family lipoprotein [candidate division KSB1 bacterium]
MSKRALIALTIFLLQAAILPHIVCAEEGFDVERLPLGDPAMKYDFCSVKLDKIYDCKANSIISFEELIQRLKPYQVVMVGEGHTSDEHHIVQYQVIKGLVESGRKVCLALEMFTPAQRAALDDYVNGKYPAEEFWDNAGWFDSWGYNIRYYQRIFDLARLHGIRLYGVNVDRKYAGMLRKGTLQTLPDEEYKALPQIDTSNVEHRFLIKNFMEGMDATQPGMFRNLYQAQSLWDAAMGDGAIRAAAENPDAVVVVLAGSGHVIYNLGIGRIIQNRSDLAVASVIPIDISQKKEESIMMKIKKALPKKMDPKAKSGDQKAAAMPAKPKMMPAMAPPDTTPSKIVIRSLGNFLWGVDDHEGKTKYPTFGVSIKEKDDQGFVIERIYPESIAEENGLQKDDVILSVDTKDFPSKNELRKYLGTKNWDEMIRFEIQRGNETQVIEFELKWTKKTSDSE